MNDKRAFVCLATIFSESSLQLLRVNKTAVASGVIYLLFSSSCEDLGHFGFHARFRSRSDRIHAVSNRRRKLREKKPIYRESSMIKTARLFT